MFDFFKKILGISSMEEKINEYLEIEKESSIVKGEIEALAEHFSEVTDNYRNNIKSNKDELIKSKIEEKYNGFILDHVKQIGELKKRKQKLQSKLDVLRKNEDFAKAIDTHKQSSAFSLLKKSLKEGRLSREKFDDICKAKNGKVKYSDIIVKNPEGKMLFLLRDNNNSFAPNCWGLPGGHVDYMEDHDVAAMRELKEETGLDCKFVEKVGEYTDNDVYIEYFECYLDEESDKEITLQEGEHSGYKWMDLSEINQEDDFIEGLRDNLEKMHSPLRYQITKIKKAFNGNIPLDIKIKIAKNLLKKAGGSKYIRREGERDKTSYIDNLNKIKDHAEKIITGEKQIERLSPTEEQGRIAGGKRNVEATLIVGTSEGTNQEGNGADTREKQEERLKNYAYDIQKSDNDFNEDIVPDDLFEEYSPEEVEKAEHEGKDVELNKPFRLSGEKKKFGVYVKNDKGNVVQVKFGDPNLSIKRDDKDRREAFRARHNCSEKKDKTTPGYWSCKMWTKKPVSEITKSSVQVLIKALEEGKLDYDNLRKAGGHKYIRREGTPGNYKYIYAEPHGTDGGHKEEVEGGKKNEKTQYTKEQLQEKTDQPENVSVESEKKTSGNDQGSSDINQNPSKEEVQKQMNEAIENGDMEKFNELSSTLSEMMKKQGEEAKKEKYERGEKHEKEAKEKGLTDQEIESLNEYTGSAYREINKQLRDDNYEAVQSMVDKINGALEKLPKHKGKVFRGMSLPDNVDNMMSEWKKGGIVTMKSFTSTSQNEKTAQNFGDFQMEIESKTGRDVSSLSEFGKGESEVLFKINAKFKVRSIKVQKYKDPFRGDVIMGVNVKLTEV